MSEIRPGIPASCAHRPTTGGLVIPVMNVRLADADTADLLPACYEMSARAMS